MKEIDDDRAQGDELRVVTDTDLPILEWAKMFLQYRN